jgi:hypothetical protein
MVRFRISRENCRDALLIQAQAHCSRPLCWYFCWYRQAKRAAANFDIPNEELSAGLAPFTTFRVTLVSAKRWDYYEILATTPADEAFKPLEDGNCPLATK